MDSSHKVGVGTLIEDYCTQCREVQNHFATVVAAGSVRRAQCLVCGSEHRYRARARRAESRGGAGVAGGSRAERSGRKTSAPRWDVLVNAASGTHPRPYSPKDAYSPGDLILHPAWDLGAVTHVEGQKMEVVFREGVKRLLCNHSA